MRGPTLRDYRRESRGYEDDDEFDDGYALPERVRAPTKLLPPQCGDHTQHMPRGMSLFAETRSEAPRGATPPKALPQLQRQRTPRRQRFWMPWGGAKRQTWPALQQWPAETAPRLSKARSRALRIPHGERGAPR